MQKTWFVDKVFKFRKEHTNHDNGNLAKQLAAKKKLQYQSDRLMEITRNYRNCETRHKNASSSYFRSRLSPKKAREPISSSPSIEITRVTPRTETNSLTCLRNKSTYPMARSYTRVKTSTADTKKENNEKEKKFQRSEKGRNLLGRKEKRSNRPKRRQRRTVLTGGRDKGKERLQVAAIQFKGGYPREIFTISTHE